MAQEKFDQAKLGEVKSNAEKMLDSTRMGISDKDSKKG